MEWMINNWYLIVAAVAAIAGVISAAVKFFKTPTKEQLNCLKEWLKIAVIQAEKELGKKTGQAKLRYVYDLFLTKFSWLAKIITFEQFSAYVDEALEWVRDQLESNKAISNIVSGGQSDGIQ